MYRIHYIFRHFEEKEDDNQEQQNDNTHDVNMKRMKVNAQVTAFTSIIELIGNVTFVIHITFTTGPSFGSFVHGQIPYMIVLPYAFLMNTSHNKNRIVEHGWINVLRNVCSQFNWNGEDGNTNSEPVVIYQKHAFTHGSKIKNPENDLISVSTILTKCQQEENANSEFLMLNTPFYEDTDPEQIEKISSKRIKSKGILLSPHELHKTDRNQIVVQNILYFMTESIKNEERYIKFFKKLLHYEDLYKYRKSFFEYEEQDEIINCDKTMEESNSEKGKSKKSKQKSFLLEEPKDDSKTKSQDDKAISNMSPSTSTIKDAESRSILRMEILKQLSSLHHQDELYKTLLENLIDLEEGFLNDD